MVENKWSRVGAVELTKQQLAWMFSHPNVFTTFAPPEALISSVKSVMSA